MREKRCTEDKNSGEKESDVSPNLTEVPTLNSVLPHAACVRYCPCRQHRDGHKSILHYFLRDDVPEQHNNDFKRNSLSLQSIKF